MRTLLALIAVLAFPLQAQEAKPKEVKKYRYVPEKYQIDLQLVPNVTNASEFNSVYIGKIYHDEIVVHGRPYFVEGLMTEIYENQTDVTILAKANGDSAKWIFNLVLESGKKIQTLIIAVQEAEPKESFISGAYSIWLED